MKSLSWIFFCLSPFALFCSENGNGLILCPVFILLGFVFKWAGSNSENSSKVTVKVKPQEFWEWHYKDRISSVLAQKDSISDGLMAYKDQEARRWATTICGYHSAWVPPESTQEQIARSYGVVTEQILKENTERYDRIQIGKFFLMKELEEKYRSRQVGKGGRERCYFPVSRIRKDMYKIKTFDHELMDNYIIEKKYKKSIKEIWESLSGREREQVMRWIEEYEKRLIEVVYEYVERKRDDVNVEIDF